jgi:hypothetical protein
VLALLLRCLAICPPTGLIRINRTSAAEVGLVPHTPSYIVLDNEVGLGHLDPAGDGGWAGDPTNTPFPQVMLVDWVRVWAKPNPANK